MTVLLSLTWIILINYHLSGSFTIANTIDCTTKECKHNDINCSPNEDCSIDCTEPESCISATVTCPIDGDCSILCRGGRSCQDMIINATLSNGNFNLQCQESTNHCKGIKIYGSKSDHTNIGNYTIICNGKQRACRDSYIECPLNSNCNIICSSDTSCRWSEIIGPTNGNLNIECNGINSCFDARFDASNSQSLNINGCTADKSCLDLTLYCPPNTNGHKNCFIEGNDNLGRDNAGGTRIYAMNGWNDIDINYSGKFGTMHSGQMFCGYNYDISCVIANDKWSCKNENDYCNFINSTNIHTISSTYSMSTELYTSGYLYEKEGEKDGYDYHLTKDRGITWYLEVRIIFGVGVLVIIIIVTICCYLAHRRSRKSFYHWKQVSIPPINNTKFANESHSRIHDRLNANESDGFKLGSITPVTNTTIENIKSPKYNIINIKSPNYCHTHMNNINKEEEIENKNETRESKVSDDILDLNPIQAEIVQVRQLLNLRKLMIQKPISHNSDDSDIGSADTNDIIQRNIITSCNTSHNEISNTFDGNNIVIETYNKFINENELNEEKEDEEEEKQHTIEMNNISQKTIELNNSHSSSTTVTSWHNVKQHIDGNYSININGNINRNNRERVAKHMRVATPILIGKHGIASALVDEFEQKNMKYESNMIEESPNNKPINEKRLSNSLSIKKPNAFRKHKSKSVKSQRKRKITTSLNMNDEEYIMASIRGDSETEMDTQSDTQNSTNESSHDANSNSSDSYINSKTDTYTQSQSVRPTAC